MNERAAYQIAGAWSQAHDGQPMQQASQLGHALASALQMLPDDVTWAAVPREGGLHALAITDGSHLWLATLPGDADPDNASVQLEHHAVAPASARLTVTQRFEQSRRGPFMQNVWVRLYRLDLTTPDASTTALEFEGRSAIEDHGGGADQGERFGRALGAALGWQRS